MSEQTAAPVTEPVVTEPVVDPAGGGESTQTPAPGSTTEPTFGEHQEYVEKLRRESASHRARAKEFEDAFQGYTPEAQKRLLGMVRGLADPGTQKATAAELRQIADAVLAAEGEVLPDGTPDPDARPLTKKEYAELRRQEEERSNQERAIREIEREATELGFSPYDEKGKPNIRYSMLLHAAQEPDVAGDIQKAAEVVKQFEQGIVDAYSKSVAEGNESFPAAAGTAPNTGPSEQVTEKKDWNWARRGAEALINARAGQA